MPLTCLQTSKRAPRRDRRRACEVTIVDPRFRLKAVLLMALALVAGCGVLRQAQDNMQLPIETPGALPRSTAWIAPEAKSGDLLYISDLGANAVDV